MFMYSPFGWVVVETVAGPGLVPRARRVPLVGVETNWGPFIHTETASDTGRGLCPLLGTRDKPGPGTDDGRYTGPGGVDGVGIADYKPARVLAVDVVQVVGHCPDVVGIAKYVE